MIDLTAFQRDIIRILYHREEVIGLDIKEILQNERDSNVNHGRLYPNLDRLVDRGYVQKTKRDGRSNNYSLTTDGINLYEDHIDRVVHGR